MLEDRTMIRERHGVANARRVAMASIKDSDVQTVTVEDGRGEVFLCMGTSSYPAGLTPEQARMIAGQLVAAAKRVAQQSTAD